MHVQASSLGRGSHFKDRAWAVKTFSSDIQQSDSRLIAAGDFGDHYEPTEKVTGHRRWAHNSSLKVAIFWLKIAISQEIEAVSETLSE